MVNVYPRFVNNKFYVAFQQGMARNFSIRHNKVDRNKRTLYTTFCDQTLQNIIN